MARIGTVEPAAYESYLRGRSFWNQRTPAGLKQAVAHFQHAIELDPGFAEALGTVPISCGTPHRASRAESGSESRRLT